jgi:hypothetical protein
MYFYNVKPAIMNIKQLHTFLFHEIKSLILEPKKFWTGKQSQECKEHVVSRIFIPLVLWVGLAIFVGEVIHSFEILWSYAFFRAVREMISYSLQFLIAVPVLSILLKNFGGTSDRKIVRLVLGYTLVPFLLASFITGLFPGLYIVSIAGLYGFYLFAIGALTLFEIPVENQSRYVILAILLIILIFGLVNILCWKLFQAFFPYGA